MDNSEVNIRLYQLLADWNPMHLPEQSMGDAEVYDMMDIVHQYEDPQFIAHRFQDIYRFTFEEEVPFDACYKKAVEATQLQTHCSL
ncbi:DUF1871 family protein [Staphylococcus auricularis]|uniref:DUF1871 domain-containing protein n=1 Tax=Staphylococcus auricularis TaxID=29379 RepID=A0ABX5IHT9_9STAP|nr:DUF1871 family protein [Staphylococcus auricularis]MCE5037637.1 DUF1871 family protein [Staphylococcus auricularis]MEB6569842.1 YugE family protein [Staphylococcus auricularis]PTH19211.1 DUF1871 domain-containing protein [Staphylococcus auricularis]PTH26245.1 DUF1871 domain-containing protein [Staphylococcus auricularis]